MGLKMHWYKPACKARSLPRCDHASPLITPLCFLLSAEVQSRHARLEQCLHPHHQCNHDQPRPAVDGAAHRHHLHVQPVLSLPPVRTSPAQRAGAAGAQPAGSARGHPLHRGRQGPTQEGWTGEGPRDDKYGGENEYSNMHFFCVWELIFCLEIRSEYGAY